ncbi:hypothetical protein BSL78_27529 [Apostichopus japonicus]|uniref:Uncharacterized protein n=1 Tax=Stichopus japonicus TaxID=307972 RepID=A0A2G8JIS3_STIJA|nr:hypothetical protein BSL78_27529 [Apostichopus japonicus]
MINLRMTHTGTPRTTDPEATPRAEYSSNPKAKVKAKTYNRAKGKAPKVSSVAKGRAASTAGASVVPSDPQDQTNRSVSVPKEPRTRSRLPVRRPSSIPDESSADSDIGFRRKRRRTAEAPPSTGLCVAALAANIGTIAAGSTPDPRDGTAGPRSGGAIADIPTVTREYPVQLDTVPPRVPRNLSSIVPDPDALELQASEAFSELGDRLEDFEGDRFPETESEEEVKPRRTTLPPDLIAKAAEIFKQRLGFEDCPAGPSAPKSSSKLRSTNEAPEDDATSIPVDPHCFERVEILQTQRRWTAFPAKQDRALRVPEEAWKNLFHPPSIPRDSTDRLQAEQGLTGGNFKDPHHKRLESTLFDLDQSSRVGMKLASTFLLAVEVLMRHHQQLPEDPDQIPDREAAQIMWLLGSQDRLVYDQFERIAIRSVESRRRNVLAAVN